MTEKIEPLSDEELAYWRGPNGYRPYSMPLVDRLLATITALKSENADLKEAKNTAREIVARWMIDNSFATGHGDSIYDLLQSLESQVCEIRSENEKLREAFEAFLVRWDECLPSIQNAEKIAHIHGWKYSGPAGGMVDVANAARAALAKG